MSNLKFVLAPNKYAICKLDPSYKIPNWVAESKFYSISRSSVELSIVCEEACLPEEQVKADKSWRLLYLEGQLDLSLVGITSKFTSALAARDVNLCVIATYDTDYLMIKELKLEQAIEALKDAGFRVVQDT
jgi:uncharacterized protein